jgi:hypothetical protein
VVLQLLQALEQMPLPTLAVVAVVVQITHQAAMAEAA